MSLQLFCLKVNTINDFFFLLHCKKIFSRFVITTYLFCQINFIIIYFVEITYYFEFLMIKLISFIVLTHFSSSINLKF